MLRAFLFAALLATACSAAPIASLGDFLKANADVFQVATAIIDKAGLTSKVNDAKGKGTYFIPTDMVFWYALSDYLPSRENSTVADVVKAVKAGPTAGAKRFANSLFADKTYANITALTKVPSITTAANTTLSATLDVSGVYVTELVDLYGAYVAGPMAVPVGEAVLYVTDSVLSDPISLIEAKKKK